MLSDSRPSARFVSVFSAGPVLLLDASVHVGSSGAPDRGSTLYRIFGVCACVVDRVEAQLPASWL